MKPSDRAWIVLGTGVVVYDVFAHQGQTLSDGASNYREARPVVTLLVIAGVAVHLSGVVPPQYDPLHWLLLLKMTVKQPFSRRKNE